MPLHGPYYELGEDFDYYDNSDKPDNISKKEWSNRLKVWEKIFTENWDCPQISGLEYSLVSRPDFTYDIFLSIIKNTRFKYLINVEECLK
jgi:hypothetical protein